MELPKPIGRQREVLYLPPDGHFVVLGTAGSGKTTLAVHRAVHLADPQTDHFGTTLLLSFNRPLTSFLKSLLPKRTRSVVVESYHKFATGYLQSRGKLGRNVICPAERRRQLIGHAVREARRQRSGNPILDRPVSFFADEIEWIVGSGFHTFDEYNAAQRADASADQVAMGDQRQIVFDIHSDYLLRRKQVGWSYDWDDLATWAREEFLSDSNPRRYRHIVIDEGQDFSPEMIRA